MAETKRVNDLYTISAPLIVIEGNLTVTGATTSVQTTDSVISDNVIVLNDGQASNGVGGIGSTGIGTSGIEIDRGDFDNVSLIFDDNVDVFKFLEGTSLTNVRVATPVDSSDAATKQYVDNKTSTGAIQAAGVQGSVQYNNSTIISGDSILLWDGTALSVGTTNITSNSITVTNTDADLEISGNGIGSIYTKSVVKMENEIDDPATVSGHNKVYAKTSGSGGTGLYFVNDTASDEFVSKSKAIVFGIIF